MVIPWEVLPALVDMCHIQSGLVSKYLYIQPLHGDPVPCRTTPTVGPTVGHTLTILFKHTISVLNPPHPLVLESEVIQKLELVKI